MNVSLYNKIHGMFAGVAIGDALGMPVETMKKEDIALLNGGRGVTYYMDPVQTRVDDSRYLIAGQTTDDWQLTKVVASSIVSSSGFDITHQVEAHVLAMQESTFGWGKGTMQSLQEFVDGLRKGGEEPLWVPGKRGSGNGVVMRVSPLAALTVLTLTDNVQNVLALGTITHPDKRARVAAVSVYKALVQALVYPVIIQETFTSNKGHLLFVRDLETNYIGEEKDTCHFVSEYLSSVDHTSLESVIATAGCGFTAWETTALALSLYQKFPTDFTQGVLAAVNAGGDTDTNASVIGALIGATIGYSAIPDEWKSISAMKEAKEVAEAFCAAF